MPTATAAAKAMCAAVVLAQTAALTVTATGPPVDVWAAVDTYHKCKIIDVPDVSALQQSLWPPTS